MRVVVDSDVLAYSVGFAVQRTLYDYLLLDGDEIAGEGIAESREELNAIEATTGGKVEAFPLVEAEPLHHALYLVKRSILAIEEALDEYGLDYDRLELFLTGKGNFRDEIATIRGYKANRIGTPKPVHYKAIRRYLRDRYKAVVVHGWEADDEVAMAAHAEQYHPDRVCIVSADKDLRTVPGRLYNFQRKEMSIISEQEAMVTFYRQILTGDATDNIVGCYKTGEAKAAKLIPDDITEAEAQKTCLQAFEKSKSLAGCPYATMSGEQALTETGRLVHMARTPAQTKFPGLWEPTLIWG